MNTGRDDATIVFEAGHMAPPPAPMAMPEQVIERRRRSFGLLSVFAMRLFAAK